MRVSSIILDHAPKLSEREAIKASFEEEGYRNVHLMQVLRWRGKHGAEFEFDVTADADSNPYEVVDATSTLTGDLR